MNEDPSVATVAFVERITKHMQDITNAELRGLHQDMSLVREIISTRLDGMDEATKVLSDSVSAVPTKLQLAIAETKDNIDLRFSRVEDRFCLLDKATERQRHDGELATASLARTQERATDALSAANAESIKRSDEHTAQTIQKNEEARIMGQRNLADKIEANNSRMDRIEQLVLAIKTQHDTQLSSRHEMKSSTTIAIAAGGLVLTLIVAIVTIWISTGR